MMIAMHLYEALADSFVAEHTDTVFALLGDGNMHWACAMAARGAQFIYSRHEHCAVSMAMAWARVTGRVGVCSVTCGPGLTQTITALPAAVRARIPIVLFAGEAPIGSGWYNQMLEQRPLVEACGARYFQIHQSRRAAQVIRDAFLHARSAREPAVIGVPLDLQEQALEHAYKAEPSLALIPPPQRLAPDPTAVAQAVDLIASAHRPILVAGRGVQHSGAQAACRSLADRIGALLATTLPARGLFHDHPFSLNVAGGFSSEVARECFAQADLIMAVGMRIASHSTDSGRLYREARVLHIDLAPRSVSEGRLAASEWLQGDALLALQAIDHALIQRGHPPVQGWRTDALARDIAQRPFDSTSYAPKPGYHDPREVIEALDQVLPKDLLMVNSSGHCSAFATHMLSRRAEDFLTIREFGAIGNGTSYALGAAVARPQQRVALIDGDGSFLMHVQELETACRHGLKPLMIVLNDEAYGSEIHKLRHDGLPDTGAVFGPSRIAEIARGFGLTARRIDRLDELPGAWQEAVQSDTAVVWDIPISDQVMSPVMRRMLASK
jgi:thiamine pyrophosphate-dependent acetolactate synthase large subunit-like protein